MVDVTASVGPIGELLSTSMRNDMDMVRASGVVAWEERVNLTLNRPPDRSLASWMYCGKGS